MLMRALSPAPVSIRRALPVVRGAPYSRTAQLEPDKPPVRPMTGGAPTDLLHRLACPRRFGNIQMMVLGGCGRETSTEPKVWQSYPNRPATGSTASASRSMTRMQSGISSTRKS